MSWKFVCDIRFLEILQTTIIKQITKGKKKSKTSKNTVKNRWNCVEIFKSAHKCIKKKRNFFSALL